MNDIPLPSDELLVERIEDAFRKAVRAADKRGGARGPRPDAIPAEDAMPGEDAIPPGIGRDILFAWGTRAASKATIKELRAEAQNDYDKGLLTLTQRDDMLFALADPPKLGGRGPASRAATKQELAALTKAAKSMLAAIENLHEPAVTALDWHLPALRRMASALRLLILCEEQAVIPYIPPGSGMGKKPDAQARRMARRTLEYFRRLIGEPTLAKPTERGEKVHSSPFVNLLTDVFEILGITRDPAHYTQRAIADHKELTRKKSGQLTP